MSVSSLGRQGGRRYGGLASVMGGGASWLRSGGGTTVTTIAPQDLVGFLLTIVSTRTMSGFRILRTSSFIDTIVRSRAFGEER